MRDEARSKRFSVPIPSGRERSVPRFCPASPDQVFFPTTAPRLMNRANVKDEEISGAESRWRQKAVRSAVFSFALAAVFALGAILRGPRLGAQFEDFAIARERIDGARIVQSRQELIEAREEP